MKSKSWLVNTALVVLSLILGLLFAEVTLRISGFSNPVLWSYDDITGIKLRAGAEGWSRSEGESFVTINSDGLRDREHRKTKPSNTFRIAVLGDSMAEALQVPLQNTFWSILEQGLNRCPEFNGRNVEVINFGVSGYGTAQELLTFRHRAASYSPDITVIAFYAGNDVRNNSRELEPNKLRPFFTLQDGQLVQDNRFLDDPEYKLFKRNFHNRSAFFDLRLFQLAGKLKSLREQWKVAGLVGARDTNVEPGLNDEVFLPPRNDAWNDAWQVTERLILATRNEVMALGGEFLLFTVPIAIQVYPDPALRERFARKLGVRDLWYPERRIVEFAQREGLDVLAIGESLKEYADKNRVFLHGFTNTRLGTGHLNAAGHKLIGDSLAKHLCPSRRSRWH